MPMMSPRFLLLGGSLSSGNRGIHAITLGTMRCLQETYPQACFALLSFSSPAPTVSTHRVVLSDIGFDIEETTTSARQGAEFVLRTLVQRAPSLEPGFERFWWADAVVDLSFGDGFGETYGLRTLFRHSIGKLITLRLGKPLAIFPQTLGPFRTLAGQTLARYLLRRANPLCVREKESEKIIRALLGPQAKFHHLADMAFLMDEVETLPSLPAELSGREPPIGVNVSGFLWNRGRELFARRNSTFDYRQTIQELVRQLVRATERSVLLIPHVYTVDPQLSDLAACQAVKAQLASVGDRVVALGHSYSAPELKAIVAHCEFFVGSRMHACIAALSTETPLVPIAYSHKFAGVLAQFGIKDWIVNPMLDSQQRVIDQVLAGYEHRNVIKERIVARLPTVRSAAMHSGQLLQAVLNGQTTYSVNPGRANEN